jgi:hypothetical protein
MEPRATQDVDVVVALKQVVKAVRLLTQAFPQLGPEDVEIVVCLRDRVTGKVRVNVMKPTQQPYREIFKHTTRVAARGQEYRVPTLEMALTSKFGTMISLGRADAKKYQDTHDFIVMVKQNPHIDLAKLEQLGDLIDAGSGKKVVELVCRVQEGEKLEL